MLNIFDFFLFFFVFFFLFLWFFGTSFKVTKVNTKCYQGYYWTPKIAKNGPTQHNKLFVLHEGQKKPWPKVKALRRARSRPE